MARKRAYTWKDFWGGIADSPVYQAQAQFTDAKNMDIRSDEYLQPSRKPENMYNPLKQMDFCVDKFAFGEDGYVYDITAASEAAGSVCTTTAASDFVAVAKFNMDISGNADRYLGFYTAAGPVLKIMKIDVSDTDGSSDWTAEASYTEAYSPSGFTSIDDIDATTSNVFTTEFEGSLYIGVDRRVMILTNGATISNGIEDLDADIVALTVYGKYIRIYLENGDVLLWDGVEGNAYEAKFSMNTNVNGVGNDGNLDRVLGGYVTASATNYGELYRAQGYDKELMSSYRSSIELYNQKYSSNFIANYLGQVYFPGSGYQPGVYSYGSQIKGLAPGFNLERADNNAGGTVNLISCLHYYNGKLYIFRVIDGTPDTYALDRVDLRVTDATWTTGRYDSSYITSRVIDAGTRTLKKKLSEIRVRGTVGTGDDIVIKYVLGSYTREELVGPNAPTWTTLVTIDDTDATDMNVRYGTAVDIEFYEIMFRVELNDGSTLEELYLEGEIIEE